MKNTLTFLGSLVCSSFLLICGLSLQKEAAELTEYQLKISSPMDILGLGYWPLWLIALFFQLFLLSLFLLSRRTWLTKNYFFLLISSFIFIAATVFSYISYALLEQKVLGL